MRRGNAEERKREAERNEEVRLQRTGAEMRRGNAEERKRKAAEMRKTSGWKKHEASEE